MVQDDWAKFGPGLCGSGRFFSVWWVHLISVMERITEWLPAVKRHHTPYHRQDQQGNHKSDYRTENVIPVEYTPWQDRLRELINPTEKNAASL
jgi:hypothetical protein